jgi:ATP-dependent Clp protease ATP-binding subunit ClpC
VGAGGAEGAIDASNMLKPASPGRASASALRRSTSTQVHREGWGFQRRFQPIMVDQPSVDDTIQILMGLRDKYEAHHGVKITDEAVVER